MKISTIAKKVAARARTLLNAPGFENWNWLFLEGNPTKSGKRMTRDQALQVSAVWACIRFYCNSIPTLPATLYRHLEEGGKEKDKGTKLYRRLKFKPNRRQNAVQFWEQIIMCLCLRGNAFIQKVFFSDGDVEFFVLYPDYITKGFNSEGYPTYRYENPKTGEKRDFTDENIIHVMHMAPDGSLGKSPLDYGMETVGAAKAAEEYASRYFANGANASGLLKHPNKLSKDAAARLKEKFDATYANPDKNGGTMVLEEGMEWTQLTITNEQSQMLQTRQFGVREICRWFGVQPHKVGDLADATFSNIEEENLNSITDTIRPMAVRIEMAFLTGMFAPDEWEEYTFEFLMDALLRTTFDKRVTAYVAAINNSIMAPDEARAKENWNPIPGGHGKKFWRPMNMQEVGAPDKKPEGEAAPGGVQGLQGKPPEGAGQPPELKQKAAMTLILDSAIDKVVRRAAKRGTVDAKFKEQARYDLEPVFRASLIVCGKHTDEAVESLINSVYDELQNATPETRWGDWAYNRVERIGEECGH